MTFMMKPYDLEHWASLAVVCPSRRDGEDYANQIVARVWVPACASNLKAKTEDNFIHPKDTHGHRSRREHSVEVGKTKSLWYDPRHKW